MTAIFRTFTFAKIHSLAGVLAGIAALYAIHAHSAILLGRTAYDRAVGQAWMTGRDQDIWLFVEVVIFGIPLAFYGVAGLVRWWYRESNLSRFNTFRNALSTLQGWSGVFLFFFVIFHVWYVWRVLTLEWNGTGLGLNPLVGEGPQEFVTASQYVTLFLNQNTFYVLLYALGIFSVAFHVANGLWNFGVNWGITGGKRAMAASTLACACLFGTVFVLGINTLTAFVRLGA